MTSGGPDSGHDIRAFIAAAERLEETMAELRHGLKEVYAAAKAAGYDAGAVRKIVAMRRKPGHEALVEIALQAIEGRREAERRLAEALRAQDPQRSLLDVDVQPAEREAA